MSRAAASRAPERRAGRRAPAARRAAALHASLLAASSLPLMQATGCFCNLAAAASARISAAAPAALVVVIGHHAHEHTGMLLLLMHHAQENFQIMYHGTNNGYQGTNLWYTISLVGQKRTFGNLTPWAFWPQSRRISNFSYEIVRDLSNCVMARSWRRRLHADQRYLESVSWRRRL